MEPGTRLGPYEIEALLGAGGMGQVFRARDTRLGRTVALKILPANRAADPDHRRRLLQEARAASALNHPNIVTLYDIARDGEVDFLVMEYVAGKSLDAAIGRGLSFDQTVRFASQIAQALTAAHAAGIVHRDIKPANILITDDEQVKVLDFGLAKLAETDASHSLQTTVVGPVTRPGLVMGTIAYMSPEQARGEPIDARTDLFALGAVLFEMSTGRQAFTRAFDWTQPSVQGLDVRLRPMVTKLLEADRNRRYQTTAGVVADLRPLLREGDSTDTPRPAFTTGWQRRAAVVATAAVVLLLIAVVVLLSRRTETPSSIATNAPATDRRLSTGGPASTNREANEAFELAMNFQGVQNDISRAQEMLERALAFDPQFAEALRYHATNSVILLLNGYSNDTSQLYRAEDEIRQVSKIDPNLPGLPSAWATVYLTQGRKELVPWQQLDDALLADPAHVNNRFWRGLALWLAGRPESAQQDFRTILEQQPLFGPARMFLAETIREQGDVRTAIVELEKVLQQAPDNISAIQWLTMAYLDTGDSNRARQLLEDKRPRFSENYLWRAAWALVLAVDGRRDEAQRALDDETLKFAAAAFPSTLVVAEFYAVVGDRTRAIEWLERAVRNGDERTQLFRNSRRLASLHEDPRFRQIIDSIEARRKASLQ